MGDLVDISKAAQLVSYSAVLMRIVPMLEGAERAAVWLATLMNLNLMHISDICMH